MQLSIFALQTKKRPLECGNEETLRDVDLLRFDCFRKITRGCFSVCRLPLKRGVEGNVSGGDESDEKSIRKGRKFVFAFTR